MSVAADGEFVEWVVGFGLELELERDVKLDRECYVDECTADRLTYGPYCGPHTAGWSAPAEPVCQKPVRCYCPREGCLGHPDATIRRKPTPMPAELRAHVTELAERRRARVIAEARGLGSTERGNR